MDYTPDNLRLEAEVCRCHGHLSMGSMLDEMADDWQADRKRLEMASGLLRRGLLHAEFSRDGAAWAAAASEFVSGLAPDDTAQANPSPKSPAGTDILRTRVCPECESVIQSGINRCPHCSGE